MNADLLLSKYPFSGQTTDRRTGPWQRVLAVYFAFADEQPFAQICANGCAKPRLLRHYYHLYRTDHFIAFREA
jgi:hypothetical protein